jgi:tetratricopeptide (TPR) repeat protein
MKDKAVHVLSVLANQGVERALMLVANPAELSAEDMMWAGLAAALANDLDEAEHLLNSALQSGCRQAQIHLAMVRRHQGNNPAAWEELHPVPVESLGPIDKTFYWREVGLLLFAEGNLGGSAQALQRAWRNSYLCEYGSMLRQALVRALAMVHLSLGEPQTALHHLRHVEQQPDFKEDPYFYSVKGLCYLYLAEPVQAASALERAGTLLPAAPLAESVLLYNRGLTAVVAGDLVQAEKLLLDAKASSARSAERETEFYACQMLTAVYAAQGDLVRGRRYLERARALSMSPRTDALVQLREGMLRLATGDRVGGITHARAAKEAFMRLRLPREVAWAQLHLAHALGISEAADDRRATLLEVADACCRWDTSGPMAIELNLLPARAFPEFSSDQYLSLIKRAQEGALEPRAPAVMLTTLGQSGLRVGDQELRLGFRSVGDILAYLVLHPNCQLPRILQDVFPDAPIPKARGYFHQVRHHLAKLCGLQVIAFDPRTREYHVDPEANIRIDFLLLEDELKTPTLDSLERATSLYRGDFLAHRTDDWVVVQRERLRTRLLNAGCEALLDFRKSLPHTSGAMRWSKKATQAADLAWRLLSIDPGNVSVGVELWRIVCSVDGAASGENVRSRLLVHFRQVLDCEPLELRMPDVAG